MKKQGLRELKKRETRQTISDVATRLFQARGFESVSVNEIAAAAQVSKMTVFNYFPRKEDLYFDRGIEDLSLAERALHERGKGVSALAALRSLVHELVEQRHVQVRFTAVTSGFWRTVAESQALRARTRELRDEFENALTKLLQTSVGLDAKEPSARLIASMLVAAWRVAYTTALRRHRAGDAAAEVRATFVGILDQAFEIIRKGARDSPFV
ncbi:MAG: transcriptional regulator, TetR family [Myxococcaceae bacterium]|nr:transcriptional regulator, TetR family [Myxococcaceae bacterium]